MANPIMDGPHRDQATRTVPKLRFKPGEQADAPMVNSPAVVTLVDWLRFILCRGNDRNPAEVVLHLGRENARGEFTLFRVFPTRLTLQVALSWLH